MDFIGSLERSIEHGEEEKKKFDEEIAETIKNQSDNLQNQSVNLVEKAKLHRQH